MARDTSPIVKQSRREGYAMHPKAIKVMSKKTGIPGQHAHGRQGKPSLYLTQLREKQKVRRTYGLLEKQFAKLMDEANRSKNRGGLLPGELLLQLLELRLDNAVYRAGFATSRRSARQLVGHGHFLLNGHRVDIPSIRLKVGDELVVRPKSTKSGYFSQIDEVIKNTYQGPLGWIKSDQNKLTILIVGLPAREEAEPDIKEQLIVEYYSR
jgi:small subunit ribosomal protein S4